MQPITVFTSLNMSRTLFVKRIVKLLYQYLSTKARMGMVKY